MHGKETCRSCHVDVFSLRPGDPRPRGRCVARRIPVSGSEKRAGFLGGGGCAVSRPRQRGPVRPRRHHPLSLLLLLLLLLITAATTIISVAILAKAKGLLTVALIGVLLMTRASRTCPRALAARTVSWEDGPVRIL